MFSIVRLIKLKNVLLYCSLTVSYAYGEHLSFNVLYPKTWYEQGLNATISIWHKIRVIDDVSHNQLRDYCDIILGKCAFAHFCLKKMYKTKQNVLVEDKIYLAFLLHKLENHLAGYDEKIVPWKDKLPCLVYLIAQMKKMLQVPSNIYPA